MTFKRLQNEIRSVTIGLLLALFVLPAFSQAALVEPLTIQRHRQLADETTRFDRELRGAESLYKRQLVAALKDLKIVLVKNESRVREAGLTASPAEFARQFAAVADTVFSIYGVDVAGPFVSDITSLWKGIEKSGALAPLPNEQGQETLRQESLELQVELMKRGQNMITALLGNGVTSIKRSVIDATANEALQNPQADVFNMTLQKLEQLILKLEPSETPTPHRYRRGPPISMS